MHFRSMFLKKEQYTSQAAHTQQRVALESPLLSSLSFLDMSLQLAIYLDVYTVEPLLKDTPEIG